MGDLMLDFPQPSTCDGPITSCIHAYVNGEYQYPEHLLLIALGGRGYVATVLPDVVGDMEEEYISWIATAAEDGFTRVRVGACGYGTPVSASELNKARDWVKSILVNSEVEFSR